MSDVKKWYIGAFGGEAQARPCSPAEFEIIHASEGRYFVLAENYDSAVQCFLTASEGCVAAERRERALQQRLTAADEQIDELTQERERLIAYGRSCGLDEASTLCSRMAYDAYYPAGSRFKVFTPKAQKALGDVLIKAANKIASLPDGPYERFKARQAKQEESAKSR